MAVLIDTSFLVALAVPDDQNYARAQRTIPSLKGKQIVPIPVMPELFYMIYTRMDYQSAVDMYRYLHRGKFTFEPLTVEDRLRMGDIMTQYQDAEFDFVDMAIMAISERLNVRQVCTFDRRDFSIFRPKHCSYLELVPQ